MNNPAILNFLIVIFQLQPKMGETVAFIFVTDPDNAGANTKKQNHTCVLSKDESGSFQVGKDGLSLQILVKPPVNRTSVKIQLNCSDNGVPSLYFVKDFDIFISSTAQVPKAIQLTGSRSVSENSMNVEVGQLSIINTLTETEIPGFISSLKGTIQLVVGNVLNFESQSMYQVNVICSDGEFSIYQVITITVKDVNEPPTAITLMGPHFLPATAIAPYPIDRLLAEDDDIGQTFTFSTSGTNSDLLQVQGGNQLVLVAPIPTELLDQPDPSISVIVQVADSGQPVLTFEQSITLTITDIDIEDLKLPEITINNTVVSENGLVGDAIGMIYDQNITVASSVTFTIASDVSSLFSIKDNKYLILSKNISSYFGNSAEVTLQAKNSQSQQVKTRTIVIVISRSDKCYNNGKTCSENARCIQRSDLSYQCKCNEDFEGDGYYCQQIDNCKVNVSKPCNQGLCKDGISSFQCLCDVGYTGAYCEVPPVNSDPCKNNTCQNSAACRPSDDKLAYTCVCKPGWTGQRCETDIDDCSDSPCPDYQRCVDGTMSFFCQCPDGKTGHRCQFYIDACSDNICTNNEKCVPKVESHDYTCCPKENIVSIILKCSTQNSTDLCKTYFLEFVQKNGRFPSKAKQQTGTMELAGKKKRAITLHSMIGSLHSFFSDLFLTVVLRELKDKPL